MTSPATINNNPIRKIPIVHRILAYAATDIVEAEQLSKVCSDWRESVEVYGKGLFAGYAQRDPVDYFRYFYELIEWGEGTWMMEHMIDAWNASFARNDNISNIIDTTSSDDENTKDLTLSSFEEKVLKFNKKNNENNKTGDNENEKDDEEGGKYSFQDFFCNKYMDRCVQMYGGAKPCVIAARHNRADVLRLIYKKGGDVDDSLIVRNDGATAFHASLRHRALQCMIVICQAKAINVLSGDIAKIKKNIQKLQEAEQDAEKLAALKIEYNEMNDEKEKKNTKQGLAKIGHDIKFGSWNVAQVLIQDEFTKVLEYLEMESDDGNMDLMLPSKLQNEVRDLEKEALELEKKLGLKNDDDDIAEQRSETSGTPKELLDKNEYYGKVDSIEDLIHIFETFCGQKLPSFYEDAYEFDDDGLIAYTNNNNAAADWGDENDDY